MAHLFQLRKALPMVVLLSTLGFLHAAGHRRQRDVTLINKAVRSLNTLSRGLCEGSTCSSEETCRDFNPCDSLFCPSNPNAICIFCCCNDDIRWTVDGVNLDECPVVKVLSVPDSIKEKVRLKANPTIPLPLIRFLDKVLPEATAEEGYSEDVLALKETLEHEEEHQEDDHSESWTDSGCHNVLRRCKKTPWEPECRACQGNPGR
ncbi:hypothetical protein BSKO_11020 [Bryopsis sp. KO-2023]|nr:hypothetical protein BSKO_11020 [Bryopsis sp. KO-2023]